MSLRGRLSSHEVAYRNLTKQSRVSSNKVLHENMRLPRHLGLGMPLCGTRLATASNDIIEFRSFHQSLDHLPNLHVPILPQIVWIVEGALNHFQSSHNQ